MTDFKKKTFAFEVGTPGHNKWLQVIWVVNKAFANSEKGVGGCRFLEVLSLEYDDMMGVSVEKYHGCVVHVGPTPKSTATIEPLNEEAQREVQSAITALDATGWCTQTAVDWLRNKR